jgi:hypothetical protein
MTNQPYSDDLAQLRAELSAQRAVTDRLRADLTRRRRRRFPRRFMPLAIVGLLVALMPLSLLAANPTFSDLSDAAPVHQENIQAIGNAGITTGFEDPNNQGARLYNPKGLVTREEMATFLARTAGLGANAPVVNAKTVPDGTITPIKLGNGGATVGQVLTATANGVAFQSVPRLTGAQYVFDDKQVIPANTTQQKEVACQEPTQLLVTGGYELPAGMTVLTDRVFMQESGVTTYRLKVHNTNITPQAIIISWVCITVAP